MLVTFRVGHQRFGLPPAAVDRVIPMMAIAALPDAPGATLGVINLHGILIPVVDMRQRLRLPAAAARLSDRLLIVHGRDRRLALAVDDVFGVETIAAPETTAGALVSATADGVVVIEDPDRVLSGDDGRQLDAALAALSHADPA
jgi:chemotaxis signal transduction protein